MEALNHSFGREATLEIEKKKNTERGKHLELQRLEEAAEHTEGNSRRWGRLGEGKAKGRLLHGSKQIVLITDSTGALQDLMSRTRFGSGILAAPS